MKKLVTVSELETRSDAELHALFGLVSKQLVQSDIGTQARRNGLASLQNLQNEINRRAAHKLQRAAGF